MRCNDVEVVVAREVMGVSGPSIHSALPVYGAVGGMRACFHEVCTYPNPGYLLGNEDTDARSYMLFDHDFDDLWGHTCFYKSKS